MWSGRYRNICRLSLIGGLLSAWPQFIRAAEAPKPDIVERAAWRAATANLAIMRKQTPKAIVIHHTAVSQEPKKSLEAKLLGLQQFSQRIGKVGVKTKPAWGDVPYHYYIDVSGSIGEGRSLDYAGDTNTNYNTTDRIQIVVEGEFDQEKPSGAQLVALRKLVSWLSDRYRIASALITGHGDNVGTACPGKNLKPFVAQLRSGF